MIQMDVEAANLPSPPTTEAQYSHNWNLMATLKKRILAIRSKMAKQSDKVYHENGLCYLFTCVYAKMIEGEPNNINNNDVQYPDSEKVESQEVFSIFQKLQIPGDVIDIDDKGDNKGDDDDDDAPSSKRAPKEGKDKEGPGPSGTPPAKEPKEAPQKGKGTAQGHERKSPSSKDKAQLQLEPAKVMESAMKGQARSTFIANPLLGIPNMVPSSANISAGKETDPHIELYHYVELQAMPTLKLCNHCILLQKALGSSLSLLESLRLSSAEIEGEHEKMKSRIKGNEEQLANVTTELLQAKEQLETGTSKPKRAPRGAAAKSRS